MKQMSVIERKCSTCDCVISERYVFDQGLEYFPSSECLYVNGYTKEDYRRDYQDNIGFWIEWTDKDEIYWEIH
jgi:hypothetical protein